MPSEPARNDRDLAAYLRDEGLVGELLRPGEPTPTVADAARALGVGTRAILKSLVFEADGVPLLVIAAGESRVSMPALARALGVSRRRVRLASPGATLAITGYPVGAMPPFGHRRPLATLIDSISVPELGVVYGGGGAADTMLRLDVGTLQQATGGRRLPLTAPGGTSGAPDGAA